MTEQNRDRPSLKQFDAYTDRNGQDLGGESPLDVGVPSRTQADLKGDPSGQAESARLASGLPRQDATDETEAETPPENLRRLRGEAEQPGASAREAIDRATAPVGQDDGKR
ncbi:hypothetical protein [Methylobacterium nigriterrae]|uniref:hypothetical protein n=1 Tax=Methylobacterium nigriterrae TaxID=3127512 RepID=UPI003013AAA0